MKKLFIMACMMASAFVVSAFTVATRTAEGITCYSSDALAKIEMAPGGEVKVYLTDESVVVIPADIFQAIAFDGTVPDTPDTPDGISDAAAPEAFVIEGFSLRSGDGGPVYVYADDGSLAAASASGIVSLSDLPSGIYIVKTTLSSTKLYLQ